MAENSEQSTASVLCSQKRPSSKKNTPLPRKIFRVGEPRFEEELTSVLLASDLSDDGEEDQSILYVDEEELRRRHESDVESVTDGIGDEVTGNESSSDDDSVDDIPLSELTATNYYYGKNRYKWAKKAPSSRVRTPQHNIVSRSASSRLATSDNTDPYSVWNKLFNDEIRQQILTWTNIKISEFRNKFARPDRPELKDLDMIELNAFLGLLFYSAVLKSNHEDTNFLFAMDGTGCEIFRCCMSETRFLVLQSCLRFDNPEDRVERQKNDRMAAVSYIFDTFVVNSQKCYELSECVTIDEMLVKFRGRSHFISYMPKKPGKYGLIIRALCDAKSFYFYNGYIYAGKGTDGIGLNPEEKKFLIPTQCVLRLTKPIQGSNRNITADNWFSSVELVDELAKRKLTYVGTVKKNKREVPNEFLPHKNRVVSSTLFGFTGQNTLCSYVTKPNKAVILISSMHHNNQIDVATKKPEIILYYNSTKGGVDETDKKCSIYSSSRRTRRWPMVIFFRVLDLSGVNACILYNLNRTKEVERGVFLKKLARSLVVPHMQRRYISTKALPRELKLTLERVLGEEKPVEDVRPQDSIENKRRICTLCPPRLHRKTAYLCVTCNKPVCLQCSNPLCKECQ